MDLKTLRERALAGSRESFEAKTPGLWLVVRPSPDEMPISFQTATVDMALLRRPLPSQPLGLEVVPIVKSLRNPYPDRISVGRARNCDVVLRFSSVSKLHAHFLPLDGGALEIADLGSHNGTTVNGRRLEPNEPTRVVLGDLLGFGAIRAQVLDAGGLYDVLRQQPPSAPGFGAEGAVRRPGAPNVEPERGGARAPGAEVIPPAPGSKPR